MLSLARQRARMVEQQIVRRGIHTKSVLDALRQVPREAFVSDEFREQAYQDSPLPIEAGQTISQPYIVALMIDAATITPVDRVLEVGTGSGYAAAVMSLLARHVFTIERHSALADLARLRLRCLGYDNVETRTGDGSLGWPEEAPFDAILVAAGGPGIPPTLCDQLAMGGRLVMPVGPPGHTQRLTKVTRTGADAFQEDDLGAVSFVPLIGRLGWPGDDPPPVPASPA